MAGSRLHALDPGAHRWVVGELEPGLAGDATLDLADYPAVSAWIARVEATTGFVDDLQPIPPDTRFGAGRSIYG